MFEGGKEEDCWPPCRVRPATVLDIELAQRDHAGDFTSDTSKIVENDGLGGISPWPFPRPEDSPELDLRALSACLFGQMFKTRTLTSFDHSYLVMSTVTMEAQKNPSCWTPNDSQDTVFGQSCFAG